MNSSFENLTALRYGIGFKKPVCLRLPFVREMEGKFRCTGFFILHTQLGEKVNKTEEDTMESTVKAEDLVSKANVYSKEMNGKFTLSCNTTKDYIPALGDIVELTIQRFLLRYYNIRVIPWDIKDLIDLARAWLIAYADWSEEMTIHININREDTKLVIREVVVFGDYSYEKEIEIMI
jgi:hypothetical protein